MAARRDNRSHRPGQRRTVGPQLLIVCGAEKTEYAYFEGMKKLHPLRGLGVVRPPQGRGKDPVKVVRQAVQQRDSRAGSFDQVWCVLDQDEFDLQPAVAEAGAARVQLAVSVPSFELWLLLHYTECGGALTPKQALARLRQQVPAYDKTRLNFEDFASGLGNAMERARRLHDGAGVGPNPSSGVWALVEVIEQEVRK